MSAQSSCLYVSVLTEQQLVANGTADLINQAIEAWRREIAALLAAAATARDLDLGRRRARRPRVRDVRGCVPALPLDRRPSTCGPSSRSCADC